MDVVFVLCSQAQQDRLPDVVDPDDERGLHAESCGSFFERRAERGEGLRLQSVHDCADLRRRQVRAFTLSFSCSRCLHLPFNLHLCLHRNCWDEYLLDQKMTTPLMSDRNWSTKYTKQLPAHYVKMMGKEVYTHTKAWHNHQTPHTHTPYPARHREAQALAHTHSTKHTRTLPTDTSSSTHAHTHTHPQINLLAMVRWRKEVKDREIEDAPRDDDGDLLPPLAVHTKRYVYTATDTPHHV